MTINSDSQQISQLVTELYVLPDDYSLLSDDATSVYARLGEPLRTIGLSFCDSLEAVIRITTLPFEYASSAAHHHYWNRALTAERIRSLKHTRGKPKTDEERETLARRRALAKYKRFLAEDGIDRINADALRELYRLGSSEAGELTARDLTRQGVVLLWSAMEVLARDLFCALLNKHPQWTDRLLKNPSTKRRFQSDKFDIQTLAQFGFDLSMNMGNVLTQRAAIDDIETIRDTFGVLFNKDRTLIKLLANERLWMLFQQRNLVVHRIGIIDDRYLSKTRDKRTAGERLNVSPDELGDFMDCTLAAGTQLLSASARYY